MSDPDNPDWALIERVATGRATSSEWEALVEWIGDDPRRRALLDDVRRIVRAARGIPQPQFDARASLPTLWARAGLSSAESRHGPRLLASLEPRRPFAWWWSRVAVLFVALGGVGGAAWWLRQAPAAGRPSLTYTTANGERSTLRLADGSRVVLAPASRLVIPPAFGDRDRSLTLDGEGYFSVVHDTAKPFIVHTPHVIATDVGTSFDVRAYSGDRAVAVGVHDGRVSLSLTAATAQPAVSLLAGDVATVATDHNLVNVRHADSADVGGWIAGRLTFRGTPLGEVVRAVSRWYNVELELGDSSLASRLLTASFGQEPITNVLLIVTRSTDTRVVYRGAAMVLLPAPAPRP